MHSSDEETYLFDGGPGSRHMVRYESRTSRQLVRGGRCLNSDGTRVDECSSAQESVIHALRWFVGETRSRWTSAPLPPGSDHAAKLGAGDGWWTYVGHYYNGRKYAWVITFPIGERGHVWTYVNHQHIATHDGLPNLSDATAIEDGGGVIFRRCGKITCHYGREGWRPSQGHFRALVIEEATTISPEGDVVRLDRRYWDSQPAAPSPERCGSSSPIPWEPEVPELRESHPTKSVWRGAPKRLWSGRQRLTSDYDNARAREGPRFDDLGWRRDETSRRYAAVVSAYPAYRAWCRRHADFGSEAHDDECMLSEGSLDSEVELEAKAEALRRWVVQAALASHSMPPLTRLFAPAVSTWPPCQTRLRKTAS